tara:strand:+ start:563 stop:1129 length:567 start_codon:yes stop_codon:yes gene_type:complete
MKRNGFIASVLAIAALPLVSFSKITKVSTKLKKGFKIDAGTGRLHGHLQLKGVNANILDVKISGRDTDGDLAVFEQTSLSQGRGTPYHVHHFQDEIFYIIAGSYQFKVGEDRFKMTVGDSIFLPRAVPHAWTQESEKGKMMVVLQPAGKLEDFFVKMSGLDHEPSKQEIAAIFAENDMEVVGPPLPLE